MFKKVLEAFAHCLLKKSKEKIFFLNSFHSTEIFNNGFLKIQIQYKVNLNYLFYWL